MNEEEAKETGTVNEQIKYKKQQVIITEQMKEETKTLLEKLGLPVV